MNVPLVDFIEGPLRQFNSPNVFNPWSQDDPLDVIDNEGASGRRVRLYQHLNIEAPSFLMIGEAPGYQGCHFSGIPFTNESLLINGSVPRVNCLNRLTKRTLPWKEPSATIVWGELYRLGIADSTVMWNAFAWHPHQSGNSYSNRTPAQSELNAGAPVLRALIDLFPDMMIVAIGNTAENTLKKLGVTPKARVRHPSMGGATKFREQLTGLWSYKQ